MRTSSIVQQVILILLFIGIVVLLFLGLWPSEEIHQEPGVMANGAPKVSRLRKEPIRLDGYAFLPVGSFTFKGRVLERRNYYYFLGLSLYSLDRGAAVSPVDFLIGWNEMSDESVLEKFRFYVDGREWSWKPDDINDRLKVKDLVESNVALVHIIPATPIIESVLETVLVGNIIQCHGEIVKVSSTSTAYSWGTSKADESISSHDYIVRMDQLKVIK